MNAATRWRETWWHSFWVCISATSIGARRDPETSGLAVFLLDQGLHGVAMALVTAVAYATVPTPAIILWPVTLATLAIVCGVCTVALGGSILVLEVQRQVVGEGDRPDPIIGLDLARLFGTRWPRRRYTRARDAWRTMRMARAVARAIVFVWSRRRESNPQPIAYKAIALPLSYAGGAHHCSGTTAGCTSG